MQHPLSSYECQVEEWVRRALARGERSLESVLAALPGVYPSVALDALARLGVPIDSIGTGALPQPSGLADTTSLPPLPVPHPLDYDWRFHEQAITNLLAHIDAATKGGDTVLFLGTPSLMRATLAMQPVYTPVLVEGNPVMIHWFGLYAASATVYHREIGREPLPPITGAVVVADPPWYEEHVIAFLQAAAQLCQPGGIVLLSAPPLGTRPGMTAEWMRVRAHSRRMGLRFQRRERAALLYHTPPFEQHALIAAGVPVGERPWRRGDLIVFTRSAEDTGMTALGTITEPTWDEVCIDSIRIRIRPRRSAIIDPRLVSMVPGDCLPSVSRRDPRRSAIDVWTSSNRVFGCANPSALAAILQAYRAGISPLVAVRRLASRPLTSREAAAVHVAHDQIATLVQTEKRETKQFWKETGYDKPAHGIDRRSCLRSAG